MLSIDFYPFYEFHVAGVKETDLCLALRVIFCVLYKQSKVRKTIYHEKALSNP